MLLAELLGVQRSRAISTHRNNALAKLIVAPSKFLLERSFFSKRFFFETGTSANSVLSSTHRDSVPAPLRKQQTFVSPPTVVSAPTRVLPSNFRDQVEWSWANFCLLTCSRIETGVVNNVRVKDQGFPTEISLGVTSSKAPLSSAAQSRFNAFSSFLSLRSSCAKSVTACRFLASSSTHEISIMVLRVCFRTRMDDRRHSHAAHNLSASAPCASHVPALATGQITELAAGLEPMSECSSTLHLVD